MSARDLMPFRFEKYDVRVVHIDGEPHFAGKDICDALGYANATDAITRHCKGVAKRSPLQTSGGVQELRVLAEADVLRLIVSSALPGAEAFERWVFEEVLPSIRRTGSYSVPVRALTPAEMFLQNAQMMVDIEQRQLAQGEQIDRVEQRVDDIAAGQVLLTRPSAAESIVHIRIRIGKLYGLPARIVDEVIRQSPYALKPVMVKNAHEDAMGGSYACFWIKDVSAVFARFVGECQRATATQATHPYIDGRFKLTQLPSRPAGAAEPPGPQAGLSF
ncbi:Bro-N domain-containing protein [Duganella sp. CT11-25]|uniref:BRO-N domain-containing protein n=1 Tax=unclassified Duganella TaxID=2636909 RepID=UPI0039B01D48